MLLGGPGSRHAEGVRLQRLRLSEIVDNAREEGELRERGSLDAAGADENIHMNRYDLDDYGPNFVSELDVGMGHKVLGAAFLNNGVAVLVFAHTACVQVGGAEANGEFKGKAFPDIERVGPRGVG